MSDEVKDFMSFLNEQENIDKSLKGFDAQETIKRMKFLSKVLPQNVQYGVPADYNGHSTTYKTLKEAIRRIQDLGRSYDSKEEAVNFYCWSITFNGSLESEEALKKKMNEAGQLYHKNQEAYGKYNIALIAKYFRDNPEDSDNIKSFTFALATPGQEPVETKDENPEKPKETEEAPEKTEQPEETGKPQQPEGGAEEEGIQV